MGRRYTAFIVIMLCFTKTAISQYTLSGKVLNEKTCIPIEYAIVSIPENDLWATANIKGEFTIRNVPSGKVVITIECLGFVKKVFVTNIIHDSTNINFALEENTLALKDVSVAAKKSSGLSTSYIMDRTALDHLQMINVTDATSLLPGGKTNKTFSLVSSGNTAQEFSINGSNVESMGNANFGVAVEVDGVRLSDNALPNIDGTDTRNIATSNIESIEIVTGIPSVEYGDMTNGLVKINTRKGASPYIAEMKTEPNTKQVTLSKGFELGAKSGVLNFNIEHTKSISDLASPYTSYDRNGLSLNYSNTFNKKKNQPVSLDIGVTGNIGGYDSKSDPDRFVNTYSKQNDNVLRANFSLKWLLNKKWITNIEASGGFNYNDQLFTQSSNVSASASTPAIHTTEEGYHVGQTYDENPDAPIILIQPGYWYQLKYIDSKLINYSAKIKANWVRKYGRVTNNLLAGGEFNSSGNNGKGIYYSDMRYAPTWRAYPYSEIPFENNYAAYAEDKIFIPIRKSMLQIVGGLRSDITSVKSSKYGEPNNLSPRANAQYIFWQDASKTVRTLSVKIGWGKTVKLPSFSVLYPTPTYNDKITFAPGTTSSGQTFYAYYTMPGTLLYNPDLKWQYNIQREISVNTDIRDTKISITAQQDKTYQPYIMNDIYSPFTYKFTDQSNLENSAIPIDDRIYTVDKNSGVVTVTDKTGTLPAETLGYKEYLTAKSNDMPGNGSSVVRKRLSWIIDFHEIESIKTSFRIDGNYYYYKGVEETLKADMPNTSVASDGSPYKYIGYYVGGANYSNGDVSKSLNMNVTAITHIPTLRLVITARVEGSLYDYSQYLSQYADGSQRGYVIDSRDAYTPSPSLTNIYGGNRFVAAYPEYYVSLDDMNTKVPFMKKFLWAEQNDIALYNELAKLVVKTNYNYSFNPNTISVYYSANIAVTKEIGRIASITFSATNFFNNMAKVRYGWNAAVASLFGNSNIPTFYYGLSLRLKL
ncbi:MAG TPA: carboxypeptidase-like regulatory domain-containing protein [Arachidicoccus sp.]